MAIITVGSDGGTYDYASLALALSNATSGDTIEIQGTWSAADTTAHTVGVSNLTIKATGSAVCPTNEPGTPTHWRHRSTSGHSFTLSQSTIEIEALDIENGSTGTSDEVFRQGITNLTASIKKCRLGFASSNSQQDIFYTQNNGTSVITFENCFFHTVNRAVANAYQSSGTTTVTFETNSCSSYNVATAAQIRCGWFGLSTGGSGGITSTLRAFNCLMDVRAAHSTAEEVIYLGGLTSTVVVDRCITSYSDIDHVTETDTLLSHNWTDDNTKASDGDWVIMTDVTTHPYDFKLQTNSFNEAEEMHSDGTGAGLTMPSDDFEGTARTAPYCCGASEIGESGPKTSAGALTISATTASGTAERELASSGTPSIAAVTVSGAAERELTSSGTPSGPVATLSGVSTVGAEKTSSGALAGPAATLNGTAERELISTGALTSVVVSSSGVADRELTSTGAGSAPVATLSGIASILQTLTSTGALPAPVATVFGTASLPGSLTSSGALTAPAVILSGASIQAGWVDRAVNAGTWQARAADTGDWAARDPVTGTWIKRPLLQ